MKNQYLEVPLLVYGLIFVDNYSALFRETYDECPSVGAMIHNDPGAMVLEGLLHRIF